MSKIGVQCHAWAKIASKVHHYCNLTVDAVSGSPLEDQGTEGRLLKAVWRERGSCLFCYDRKTMYVQNVS